MSDPKHTEDKMGLYLVAAMPIIMIAIWAASLVLGGKI